MVFMVILDIKGEKTQRKFPYILTSPEIIIKKKFTLLCNIAIF